MTTPPTFPTFAAALEVAIKVAGKTKSEVSLKLGYNKTFISNVLQRNAIAKGNYTKLLRMFPELKNAPLPKNLKPSTKNMGGFREQREKLGVTIAELARRTKLSSRWIGRIERGEANPSEEVKNKLARALKKTPLASHEEKETSNADAIQALAALLRLRREEPARPIRLLARHAADQFSLHLEAVFTFQEFLEATGQG